MKLFAQAVHDTEGKRAWRYERIFRLKFKTRNAVQGLWSLPHPHGPCTDIQSFQQSADARLPRHKSCSYRAASSIACSHSALPVPAPSLGAECKEYWDQLGMLPSHRPLTSFSYWHQLIQLGNSTISTRRPTPVQEMRLFPIHLKAKL